MIQRCLKGLARTFVVLVALASTAGTAALHAQSFGKIQGVVKDPQGQPIANARVTITNTAFSAPTDARGFYFINNVPAGVIIIRATYVGYKPHEVEGVRIPSGQTVTQDFTLEQTPVTVQDIVVKEEAKNALVPRDAVTTKQAITGDMTKKLPVDRYQAVLALQPGVVQVGTCNTNGACNPTFSVRGSRTDENVTYLDGVPVQNGNRAGGAPQFSIGTNAFEDASITTGASSAEFGNAQGGVINISTRSGGRTLAGNLGFETAELGGQRYGQGYNIFQGSISGPVMKNMTFFVSGKIEGTNSNNQGYQGWLYPSFASTSVDRTFRVPKTALSLTSDSVDVTVYNRAIVQGDCQNMPFMTNAGAAVNLSDTTEAARAVAAMRNNYGVSCKDNTLYSAPFSTYYNTEKLTYSFGKGSSFFVSYNFSGTQQRNTLGDGYNTGTTQSSNVATANWTQTLIRQASHQLTLNAIVSYQWNSTISGTLTPESEAATRSSSLGIITHKLQYTRNPDNWPVDSTLLLNFLFNRSGHRIGITDPKASGYGAITSYGSGCPSDAIGCDGTGGGGADGNSLSYSIENRLVGKADLDWQLDRYNRLKFGGEGTKWVDYTAYGGGTSERLGQPRKWDTYAEDRLDLGDVVLVGGVRYDYFWSQAWRWRDFPRISTRPGFSQLLTDSARLANLYCPVGASAATLATSICPLVQDPSHNTLSPHIQVSFPVTDKTNFRLSYAQNTETPSLDLIYLQAISDIDASGINTRSNFGGDLDFGKTITFEFGARHAFSDDMVADVAIYNKDNVANPGIKFSFPVDPVSGVGTRIYTAQNTDFGNTRGLDVRIDRRLGNYFNGSLTYSFQQSKNTGTDPTSYISYFEPLVGSDAVPPTSALPTGTSRPHSLTALFNLNLPPDWEKGTFAGKVLNRVGFYVNARVASGLPYTRCDPADLTSLSVTSGGRCGTLGGVTEINAARLPTFKQLDARMTKDFRLGKYAMTAYLDARNIMNFQNVTSVYATTGTTSNGAYWATLWTADSNGFQGYGKNTGELVTTGANAGAIQLPSTVAGCTTVSSGSTSYIPACYAMIRSEQRFGNGDGLYTVAEQHYASDVKNASTKSIANFISGARTLRFGFEVNF